MFVRDWQVLALICSLEGQFSQSDYALWVHLSTHMWWHGDIWLQSLWFVASHLGICFWWNVAPDYNFHDSLRHMGISLPDDMAVLVSTWSICPQRNWHAIDQGLHVNSLAPRRFQWHFGWDFHEMKVSLMKFTPFKLPWIFLRAPLKVNAATRNIQVTLNRYGNYLQMNAQGPYWC